MIEFPSCDVVPVDHKIQPKGVVFNVEKLGGDLTQWYYSNANTYEPDRKQSPLLLKPSLKLVFSESKRTVVPTFEAYWYANGTLITNTTDDANADYVKLSNGQLRVKKNVTPQAPVEIKLQIQYVEPESGLMHKIDWSDTLSASNKADTVYGLSWLTESMQVWNPVSGASSQKTFRLKATLGDVNVSNQVKFFWYYVSGNSEVLINTHQAYVSGQNTDTLVVDADKAESLNIMCRIASSLSAASPDQPVRATGSMRWRLPKLRGRGHTANGLARRESEKTKTFQLAVQAGGRGGMVSDSVRKRQFIAKWIKQENGTTTTVAYGDNPGIEVSSIESAVVKPVLYLLGPDEPVIADDGVAVIADDGEAVCERS